MLRLSPYTSPTLSFLGRKLWLVESALAWLLSFRRKANITSKTYRVEFNTSKFSLKYTNDLDYYHTYTHSILYSGCIALELTEFWFWYNIVYFQENVSVINDGTPKTQLIKPCRVRNSINYINLVLDYEQIFYGLCLMYLYVYRILIAKWKKCLKLERTDVINEQMVYNAFCEWWKLLL